MTTVVHIQSHDKINTGGAIWQKVVSEYVQTKLQTGTLTVHKFSLKALWSVKKNTIDGIIYEHPYNLVYAIFWFIALRLFGNKPYIAYSMHNNEPELFRYGARKKSFYNFCKFVITDALALRVSSKVFAPLSLKNRKMPSLELHLITLDEVKTSEQLKYYELGSIRLSFIGSSFWKPNMCGVLEFLSQFKEYSDYVQKVTFVGGGWASVIPQNDQICCTGYLEDLSAIIEETDIFIAPIQDNYGVNVKLYEYLKYNKTILSTYEASRGINSPLIIKLDMQHWIDYLRLVSNAK
tara:strand:- start:629 stop:1507 length:879 start_codon:yes stop_codon:yes gene_type:complete